MRRQPVSSSNLYSVGHEPETSTLEIEFRGRRIYQYSNVPAQVYDELMGAGSHGQYFHRHIRDVYPYRKIA